MTAIVTGKLAEAKITFPGPVVVDLSAYTIAFEPSSEVETVDLGVFSDPKASDTGRVTDSLTLAMLWSPQLYDALSPYVDIAGTFAGKYTVGDTRAVRATVKFGTLPWGRFEIGTRVEVDLVLVVTTGGITYS